MERRLTRSLAVSWASAARRCWQPKAPLGGEATSKGLALARNSELRRPEAYATATENPHGIVWRMGDGASVTALLEKWGHGDRGAPDELLPIVYDELRRLSAGYLRREAPGGTIQPTALAPEVYLHFLDQRRIELHNRSHFLGPRRRLSAAFWWTAPGKERRPNAAETPSGSHSKKP